jgi:predicted PurR-regulated permease PerM
MWVLVALAIGANVMGFSGMLIFIPLSSVLYVLFREYIYKRLIDRGVSPDKLRLHDRTPKKEEDTKQGEPESSQK